MASFRWAHGLEHVDVLFDVLFVVLFVVLFDVLLSVSGRGGE
jgi:hypothetical protein